MWIVNVFVLPSYFETFGVVLIEAMATALPVIATKCGGPEDFVTPEVGYLVNPGDIQELAKAMIVMYTNSSSFESAEISKIVKDKFSYSAVETRLIQIYNKVLSIKT